MKYKVYATYCFEKDCCEIEADSPEQACELADELGLIPSYVSLCHYCNRQMYDTPRLESDEYIFAEECEE